MDVTFGGGRKEWGDKSRVANAGLIVARARYPFCAPSVVAIMDENRSNFRKIAMLWQSVQGKRSR